MKLHTLLDLRGNIPSVCFFTPGSVHDVNLLDHLVIEVGAFYILDRGYLDVACLHRLHQTREFIMTGATRRLLVPLLDSRSVGRTTGVYSDQTIRLYGFYRRQSYPGHLRRVRYFDADRPKWRVFLSNNFTLPARTLAQPCQCRW